MTAGVCRLSKLAEEDLTSLQASNFSSTGDISAHASGVRTLVLRVLKAAISLTKAKPNKRADQVRGESSVLCVPSFVAAGLLHCCCCSVVNGDLWQNTLCVILVIRHCKQHLLSVLSSLL